MASNVRTTWEFLRGKGLSPAQAAGVIGSMQGESGPDLNPAAVNPNGGATGIAQWLGGRRNAAVLTKRLGPQLNHLWGELQGPESAALKALKGTHTPEQAAIAWQRVFERGAPFEQKYDMRAKNARNVFNQLRGVAGSASAGGGGGASGTSSGGQTTSGGLDQGTQQSVLPLIQALTQQSSAPPAANIQAPSFAAHPILPEGFGTVSGGGGPAPKADIGALAAAVKTLGGSVPAAGQSSTDTPATDSPTVDASGTYPGMSGNVKFSASADRPGVHTQQITKNFLSRIAGFSHRTINVGTGTNHNQMTTSGNVSDHWTGHAADLPMPVDSKIGDLTAAHALEAAGVPWSQAYRMAQQGGVFNITPKRGEFKGHRVQVLWKTMVGGNHHNHVHVGIR